MITVKNLSKSFNTPNGKVNVLNDISFNVKDGDIFGVVGFSGAGKSTLIRCINGLEKVDSGDVIVGDSNITKLDRKALNKARKKIGMIFQQFNLLDSRTVYENIAFPLEISGYKKEEIKERVEEILELVELTHKRNSYPVQLSGGQKQRVGIARALANKPDVLLSDEATSALDPQTTYSILELLKNINKKLDITIILITHELDVLRYATNNMIVLEDGQIVESGETNKLFTNPKSDTLRKFINITDSFLKVKEYIGGEGI